MRGQHFRLGRTAKGEEQGSEEEEGLAEEGEGLVCVLISLSNLTHMCGAQAWMWRK